MTADVSAVLTRAAELVEAGWVQGSNFEVVDGVPCFCAIGALFHAARGSKAQAIYPDARIALSDSMGLLDVPAWNDTPGRTQSEVVAALRAAAAEAAS